MKQQWTRSIRWWALGGTILTALGPGCLVNKDLYLERKAALTDGDGDGYNGDQGDCDDGDAEVYPGAAELCNEVDDDCDGVVDEDPVDGRVWYLDGDGDLFGDSAQSVVACAAPDGWVTQAGDCDDQLALAYPGAAEVAYDGIDQDCSGADLVDVDGDGWAATQAGGTDCDDDDAQISPSGVESWAWGFQDRDCDGALPALELEVGAEAWTGPSVEARGGARVAALGGSDSFLVAAFLDDTEYTAAGAVFIVGGGTRGTLASQPSIRPATGDVGLGVGLDGADADGDGLPEVIVGGSLYDDGRGAAWLLSGLDVARGADLRVPADAALVIEGTVIDGFAGAETCFVGDSDGDGVEEIAISAPFAVVGSEAEAGVLALVSAADRGTMVIDDADVLWQGWYAGAKLGTRVFAAEDQDGDGYADVLVSGQYGNLALILPGGEAGGSMQDGFISQVWAEHDPGASVPEPRMVGDVDGDGARDLVMLHGADSAWPHVYVHTGLTRFGSRAVDDAYAAISADGLSEFYDAIDLGDRDGDGLAETLLTVPERSSDGAPWFGVLESSALSVGATLSAFDFRLQGRSNRPTSFLGQRGAFVGDVDGDGHDDFVLGGYGDDEGGTNSGHAIVIPVPAGR